MFFTINNLLKVPPYVASGLITSETLRIDLPYLPAIPVGILAGWGISRLLSQKHFDWLVQVLLVVTSPFDCEWSEVGTSRRVHKCTGARVRCKVQCASC